MSYPTYDLTMVVPSRERPEAIRELAGIFQGTTDSVRTRLVVAVDEDDPYLISYRRVWEDIKSCRVGITEYLEPVPYFELVVGPPSRIGPILNTVVPRYAEDSFAVGFMGDDHRPRDYGWDQRYIDALVEMGTGVVYGNDLIQGESIPTQCAMTSDIVRATGHFVPEGMLHLWLDNAWKSIGEATNIRYLPDVIVEHMHPLVGKGTWDESYLRNNADAVFDSDKATYDHWKQHILPGWVAQIRAFNA